MSEVLAIEFCSNAMVLIGADPISSFEDGSNEAYVAGRFYERTLKSVLTEHKWSFASRWEQASLLSGSPNAVWAYKYQLPTGLLALDSTSPDFIQYELYQNRELWTNYNNELFIEGKFRVEEETFPEYFAEYLEMRLAQKFAMPITDDESKETKFANMVDKYKLLAKQADSRQRKNVGIKKFPLISARG